MAPDPQPGTAEEPLLNVGVLTATATAVLALLVSFGLPISDTQQTAILGVVAVAAPILVAALGRARVYAPATVRRLLTLRRGM